MIQDSYILGGINMGKIIAFIVGMCVGIALTALMRMSDDD